MCTQSVSIVAGANDRFTDEWNTHAHTQTHTHARTQTRMHVRTHAPPPTTERHTRDSTLPVSDNK